MIYGNDLIKTDLSLRRHICMSEVKGGFYPVSPVTLCGSTLLDVTCLSSMPFAPVNQELPTKGCDNKPTTNNARFKRSSLARTWSEAEPPHDL